MYKLTISALLAILSSYSYAANWKSGPEQVNLIELYTSEGCSSCPPADRWLSSLSSHPGLWQQFIPIALHVDYWDYIGWKDPYAHPDNSQRQRKLAKINNSQSVYTPGFFLNGKEWKPTKLIDNNNQKVGQLTLSSNEQKITLTFSRKNTQDTEALNPAIAHVTLLGFALQSDVKKGENHGKQLDHDFVVLNHQQSKNVQISHSDEYSVLTWTLPSLKTPNPSINTRYGIAAWIEEKGKLQPIQAVGGWLNTP